MRIVHVQHDSVARVPAQVAENDAKLWAIMDINDVPFCQTLYKLPKQALKKRRTEVDQETRANYLGKTKKLFKSRQGDDTISRKLKAIVR
jgi:hypothetical protein